MRNWRVPWWIYVIAAVYVLTFFFNARQEAWGPANAGWVPSWPTFRVAAVAPGRPMEKGGVRAGDVLKAVNGQPLTGMPDWFVARAHFERKTRDSPVRHAGERLPAYRSEEHKSELQSRP